MLQIVFLSQDSFSGNHCNRLELEKDGRTASSHVVFYKDRRDAEEFCRKRALTGMALRQR